MSGDVQPRKRKDKKRKKDDGSEHGATHAQPPIIPNITEEQNIHIHKEEGTGGGICAKFVFFLLFSALIVCIGLIITEHRGLTDLDTAESESRFSQIFEGWIDSSPGHEDDNDHLEYSLENHEDEEETHDSHEMDDEHDEEDDEEQQENELSKEESQQDEEEVDEAEEDEDEIRSEEDDDEEVDEDNEDRSDVQDEDDDDNDVDDGDDDNDEEEEEDEEEGEEENVELFEEKEAEDDNGEPSVEDNEEEDEDNISEQAKSDEDHDDEDNDNNDEIDEEDAVEDEESDNKEVAGSEENVDRQDEVADEVEENHENSRSINVRPDNEPEESDSDKQSDDAQYEYENVTNKDDWKIKEKIDQAQKAVENNAAYAVKLFEILLEKYPTSPRCYYGKAQALDKLAEQKRSNNLLQQAINTYLKLLDLHDVPDVLFENAAERCINRMRFIGDSSRAVDVHLKLIDRFPNTPKHRNQLAVSYLTINRPNEARFVLKDTLSKYPNDGFALVHYGFILKTADNNLNQSVDYMRRGIATKDPGVIDGRFYFHLGDALARLGKVDEAMKVYEEGVANNLFLSKYQRSLYNVDRLTGKPWWDKNETPYQKLYTQLESNWEIIRNEGLALLGRSGYFQNESENLKDTGDWKQFELFARGQKNIENCKKCPATCRIIESIPEARSCRRGQTKFSVMHPGTHVWPHCGPTNCRLRIHLGLSVPPNTFIRVADEIRSWENGKILIFDDSFEHEVWHNGTELRLVLIVDVWHPELTITEERTLSPI